jgi:hypothetical protein
MSTKNLARTTIEGGRASWNRCGRRYSNRLQRCRQRDSLVHAARDLDADELVIPERPPLRKDFRDKLGPPERWLNRQVGRPWRLVRGELLRKFDTRTTAGRHLVFDHMLPWVDEAGHRIGHHRFLIDAHGILRRGDRWRPYGSPWVRPPLPRSEHELAAWLAGRRVGARGDMLFWFVETSGGGYRQDHRLSEDDAALWRALPDWFRACHDPFVAATRYAKPLS